MKRILISLLLLLLVVFGGTIGYMTIERWNFFDSAYMTIITISTVGFHEVRLLNDQGRIFTAVLILFGIGIGGYTIANISAFIIEGHIQNLFKGRKMEKQIEQLKNHIIVCGFGKTGVEIVDELSKTKTKFLVVELNENKVNDLHKQGHLVIAGDATEDEILEKAGVYRAAGLITALPNDADNVYVVLSAKGANPKIRVVARATDQQNCKKLFRAGADKVVSPYSIAGRRMARLIVSPAIVDFLEVMTQSQELELKIEEVTLEKGCQLEKLTLRQSNIKGETDGATVIGIKKDGKKILVNPHGDTLLEEGDVLFVIGNELQIVKLHEMAQKKRILDLG